MSVCLSVLVRVLPGFVTLKHDLNRNFIKDKIRRKASAWQVKLYNIAMSLCEKAESEGHQTMPHKLLLHATCYKLVIVNEASYNVLIFSQYKSTKSDNKPSTSSAMQL